MSHAVTSTIAARADWLEDVLAGLLINGISRERIAIQHHPGCRIVVTIDGAPKYEWCLTASRLPVAPQVS